MDEIILQQILELVEFVLEVHFEKALFADGVVGRSWQPEHHGFLQYFRIVVINLPLSYVFLLEKSIKIFYYLSVKISIVIQLQLSVQHKSYIILPPQLFLLLHI